MLNQTKILCVDDRRENLFSLQSLIDDPRAELLMANSGEEALELILNHSVALALIDVQMPRMNGFELAKIIRGRERNRQMPLIFVTASPSGKDMIFEGYEQGAVDFLQKPLDPHIVRSKVKVFIELDQSKRALDAKLVELERLKIQAEQANAIKSRFVANMSHEIRTPLSAILGFSQLLDNPKIKEEQKKDFIHCILENGKHLNQLIDDILDLSRIESGNLAIENKSMNLTEFLQGIEQLFATPAQKKGIQLTFEKDPDCLERISSDPLRLKQILVNIIGNALKFTGQGSIQVRTSMDHSAERGRSFLNFQIRDTGPGLPPNKIDDLFRPFYQGDNSNTRNFGGTGLGLSISKHLARALGGDVTAENHFAPHGAVFNVSIDPTPSTQFGSSTDVPLVSSMEFKDTPETPQCLQGVKILLVEDSKYVRKLVKLVLELSGGEVDVAEDGIQGHRQALEKNFDIILMDIQMPGMDGYETMRRLRQQNVITPAVAFTAHAMKEEKQKCFDAGFDGHISKPIDHEQLLSVITEMTQKVPLSQ